MGMACFRATQLATAFVDSKHIGKLLNYRLATGFHDAIHANDQFHSTITIIFESSDSVENVETFPEQSTCDQY